MYIDCCVRGEGSPYRELTLDVIFNILGDPTYTTPRKLITPGKIYFVYALAGEGTLCYDGAQYTVRRHDFLFMQPTRDFSYCCTGSSWDFWWFEFTGEPPVPCNSVRHCPYTQAIAALPPQMMLYAKLGAWDVSSALFLALCELLRHGAESTRKSLRNELFLGEMEDYIRENIQTVTVAELEQAFGIQERTLRNLFYRTLDISPKRFITKMRLSLAGHLLTSTAQPLEQIARATGFSSQFHLSKQFKEYFGVSPVKYRNYIH